MFCFARSSWAPQKHFAQLRYWIVNVFHTKLFCSTENNSMQKQKYSMSTENGQDVKFTSPHTCKWGQEHDGEYNFLSFSLTLFFFMCAKKALLQVDSMKEIITVIVFDRVVTFILSIYWKCWQQVECITAQNNWQVLCWLAKDLLQFLNYANTENCVWVQYIYSEWRED